MEYILEKVSSYGISLKETVSETTVLVDLKILGTGMAFHPNCPYDLEEFEDYIIE